jgi:hypothetical protein
MLPNFDTHFIALSEGSTSATFAKFLGFVKTSPVPVIQSRFRPKTSPLSVRKTNVVHGYALEVVRIKEIERSSEKRSLCIFISCLSQRREDKLNVAELAYYDLSK